MTGVELHHYSRALDEIYFLRCLAAYQASMLRSHLSLATYPRSRRRATELQIEQLLQAALGHSRTVYADMDHQGLRAASQALGISTLTRSQFEAEQQ